MAETKPDRAAAQEIVTYMTERYGGNPMYDSTWVDGVAEIISRHDAPLVEALKIYADRRFWDEDTRDRFTYNDSSDLGPTVWGYLLAEAALDAVRGKR